ncbi:PEP-CTERM/exosortase system-associated acyltransferase [Geomesophilobacter sediminis]|uniref:PEP-CTERM/exosortase system-associated acyltransferase n=1 Tax=Geomesophilobacter sediminis TaxID=2798584 RepID=A0A8J7LUE6_9BACT|nr:PEP-CTERM/exosortase system-associated acyltransferase [Geomesophilobacter sediminis]MBJ6723655.1 PEP-CTERM/exosortase system-associated acyltransferase [Geomesophilobacter sediminis]
MQANPGNTAVRNQLQTADNFDHWFDLVPANTPTLREHAYRLRFQVYCKERNYEDPRNHPNQCESDEYDVRSSHSLLIERATGLVAGTVRLILPHPDGPGASFPFQRLCTVPLFSDARRFANCAEISRFSISKEFRQRTLQQSAMHSAHQCLAASPVPESLMPCLTLGLIKGVIHMSAMQGVTDLLAVMEPALLRLLSRLGVHFHKIGPLVEFHGLRQPCHIDLETLLTRVAKERHDVWRIITNEGQLIDLLNHRHPQTRRPRGVVPGVSAQAPCRAIPLPEHEGSFHLRINPLPQPPSRL